jgi:hypothetical protein
MSPKSQAQRAPRLLGLGEQSPREHTLGALDTAVGSDRENDLVIVHPTVSRRHAILGYHAGAYTLADLQSTNGTFVNGKRIRQPVAIKPGDEIGFGATKFTMVAGNSALLASRPHPSRRMIIAAVGIAGFGLMGFLVTRALEVGRSARQPAAIAPSAKPSAAAPVIAEREPAESAAAVESPTPEAADNSSPAWLKHLNEFRASVGLMPVNSDSRLSDGDRKHATYILKNFATELQTGGLGGEAHTEDPSRPFYTPEGAEAARTSNVGGRGSTRGTSPDPEGWAIDGWMAGPFHRISLLSPLLHDVGFAAACDEHSCVALLNVLSGADPLPSVAEPLAHPILYPPDGGTVPVDMAALDTEWPTPVSGCDGYAFPVGLPITVQLGPMVDAELDSFSFSREDGSELPACGFDANSYRNPVEDDRRRVVAGLRSQGAIVIVPRQPLEPGARYDVLATVNGSDYKWSFAIAAKAASGQAEGGNR